MPPPISAVPASNVYPMNGVMQVAGPADLARRDKKASQAAADKIAQQKQPAVALDQLAGYIRSQWDMMKVHRNSAVGWSNRLIDSLRVFNGQYDPTKLGEIRQFGGSEVYARLISMKCRGTSSLLRDVYLNTEKPWGIDPPADPDIPDDILAKIQVLVNSEVQGAVQAGTPPDPASIRDRIKGLVEAARDAEKVNARERAQIAEDRIQEILVTGGFYQALAEFITDLPLFPIACMKGPVVKIVPTVNWKTGKAVVEQKPTLFWNRVSPFDIWFTPGASDIATANVIERQRLTRGEINDLLDLPGYDQEAVRCVLQDYGSGGLSENWDVTDTERSREESRENPTMNRSGMITSLEFHGYVQGKMLLDWGMKPSQIKDADRDYSVQAWMIGQYVIKCQLTPSPRQRHPYYITSFEKVPGTPVGNALPDILADIQDVANATLRTLVNNMSIASGPQVVVNDDRLGAGENGEQMYPWKRWHVTSDPMGNKEQAPISFFMPTSNAGELLTVYQKFSDMADDMSAIPKFMSGSSVGGAGRTASGLSMLMSNASKILQTVAANIDGDVIEGLLMGLFDMIMLTDTTGILRGDENVRVKGVNVAAQRETERVRQLEFLQVTMNPMDAQIMGARGRASVLRSVSETIGLDGTEIVPSDTDMMSAAKAQANAPQPGQPPGATPGGPAAGQVPPNMAQSGAAAQGAQHSLPANNDQGPRTNLQGGVG